MFGHGREELDDDEGAELAKSIAAATREEIQAQSESVKTKAKL